MIAVSGRTGMDRCRLVRALYGYQRESGVTAEVSDAVERITGRAPRCVEQFFEGRRQLLADRSKTSSRFHELAMTTETHPASLPQRAGPRPRTTPTNPHVQLDQNAPVEMQRRLAEYMFGFPCIEQRESIISVPGARAMWLSETCHANADRRAFLRGREHAHIHPPSDGSLHIALPPELADEAVAKGWAELHPVAMRGLIPMNIVMVYGPRDEAELAVVRQLVDASFRFAHPEPVTPDPA